MKRIAALAVGAMLAGLLGGQALAQDYPNRLIKVFNGFPPGSFSDIVARAVVERASKMLGQSMIVENKPGVGGLLVTKQMMTTEPDGYSILFTSNGHAANVSLFKEVPYDAVKDFTPLSQMVQIPFVLMVRSDLGVKTAAELIKLAKSKPGTLKYGSGNTSSRAAAELLNSVAGIDLQYIPYRGMPQAVTDLMSGQIDVIVTDMSFLLSQGPEGKMRGLAVATDQRVPQLPDVPTFKEAGIAGAEVAGWHGVIGPPNLPAPVVTKLNAVLREIGKDPSFQAFLNKLGTYAKTSTPEEFAAFIKADADRWTQIHTLAKIEKQ